MRITFISNRCSLARKAFLLGVLATAFTSGALNSRNAAVDAPPPWSEVAVDGGDVFDVAVSPTDPQLVYAAVGGGWSPDGALYRSTDGARTWARVTAVPRTGFDSLAFAQDGRVYVGGRKGMYVGSADGRLWSARSRGLPTDFVVRTLAVDRADPLHVWAGLDRHDSGSLFESSDGGQNWISRMPPIAHNSSARAVVLHPTNSDIVVALFDDVERVWVSTNGC